MPQHSSQSAATAGRVKAATHATAARTRHATAVHTTSHAPPCVSYVRNATPQHRPLRHGLIAPPRRVQHLANTPVTAAESRRSDTNATCAAAWVREHRPQCVVNLSAPDRDIVKCRTGVDNSQRNAAPARHTRMQWCEPLQQRGRGARSEGHGRRHGPQTWGVSGRDTRSKAHTPPGATSEHTTYRRKPIDWQSVQGATTAHTKA